MKFSFLLLLLCIHGWVQPAEAKWSVTTYNIRNFDQDYQAGQTDLNELGRIIREVQSDVMAFEEVVNRRAFDALIRKNLPGYQYKVSSCGGFGKQNLAVVFNQKTFEYVEHEEDLSLSGSSTGCGSLRPLFLVTLRHRSSKQIYTFGAAHLKAGGSPRAFAQRWQQYEKLEKVSRNYDNKNLILLGDLNTTGYNIKNEDYRKFEDFISSAGLRTMTENIECTNYWTGTSGGSEYQPSILDHIIIQDKLVKSVESVRIAAHCSKLDCRPATPEELGVSFESVSDHCPLQVTFK
ncbi:MAG: endonuclease/exonuclease/phosphatase family protein [Bacteriovoracia bacterium]